MPKRTDIKKIMIIGSGPIVIGQACEFDYSGSQACKALVEEGYEVVLINSNPATIMTDPELAHRTYVEPLTQAYLEDILKKERPDALLPTMGGQTALNLALQVEKAGILKELGIEMIGAQREAIELGEDREKFRGVLERVGVEFPANGYARSLEDAHKVAAEVGFPCIIRPSYTLGGSGASVAHSKEEYDAEVIRGLSASPVGEVLIDQSVLGWKEYELEVVRDCKDNVIIICSIENIDPMGVHTGDSITVAPAQTLTDVEYQTMRNAAIRIIREVGVETGGSNIQFAVCPKTGRLVAIEMNPRVSRSSALASKATGFPIAKIAAKLAVGYTLDELPNDITKKTLSCFEPSIDYVVTKMPRFAFDKFPRSDSRLSPQMKSVGEVMGIGRTFKESLQKALRSLETKLWGLNPVQDRRTLRNGQSWADGIRNYICHGKADRILWVAQAMREGISLEEIHELSKIDPWFLDQIHELVLEEKSISKWAGNIGKVDPKQLKQWKRLGFSDSAIAYHSKSSEDQVRSLRKKHKIIPSYKMVDTCGAEFESFTPYMYSTYEGLDDPMPEINSGEKRKKIVILGGGPNRIGQGIEFDYCCVRASFALREEGYESIMINCNPETVSTDYDVSNKLYFEPLYYEDIVNILDREKPDGIIVHFGGQTPLNLSRKLNLQHYPIIGTSADAIDITEDRDRFRALCHRMDLRQPESVTVASRDLALEAANQLGFPLLVRPSFVLGGGGMQIIYNAREFQRWLMRGIEISEQAPLLIDRFLKNAIEVDVDALSDGQDVFICGMMEQVQEAGVHSGDSACVLPPTSLSVEIQQELERQTTLLARELNVVGLMNIQYAIENEQVYILEVNPRASRTVPFASKARGIPFSKLATKVMLGQKLKDFPELKGDTDKGRGGLIYVKESVFPFDRFPGTDLILGPEMRSTGEVMGVARTFAEAYGKANIAAGFSLPKFGKVFFSVKDSDKELMHPLAKQLAESDFKVCATRGTAKFLKAAGIDVEIINKVNEGRPNIVDVINNGEIDLVINTSALGVHEVGAAYELRRATLMKRVPFYTTVGAATAATQAILSLKSSKLETHCLQERN